MVWIPQHAHGAPITLEEVWLRAKHTDHSTKATLAQEKSADSAVSASKAKAFSPRLSSDLVIGPSWLQDPDLYRQNFGISYSLRVDQPLWSKQFFYEFKQQELSKTKSQVDHDRQLTDLRRWTLVTYLQVVILMERLDRHQDIYQPVAKIVEEKNAEALKAGIRSLGDFTSTALAFRQLRWESEDLSSEHDRLLEQLQKKIFSPPVLLARLNTSRKVVDGLLREEKISQGSESSHAARDAAIEKERATIALRDVEAMRYPQLSAFAEINGFSGSSQIFARHPDIDTTARLVQSTQGAAFGIQLNLSLFDFSTSHQAKSASEKLHAAVFTQAAIEQNEALAKDDCAKLVEKLASRLEQITTLKKDAAEHLAVVVSSFRQGQLPYDAIRTPLVQLAEVDTLYYKVLEEGFSRRWSCLAQTGALGDDEIKRISNNLYVSATP